MPPTMPINFMPGRQRTRVYGSCESIRMNATRPGLPLRFTQAWLVACCTTTVPALQRTSRSASGVRRAEARQLDLAVEHRDSLAGGIHLGDDAAHFGRLLRGGGPRDDQRDSRKHPR